METDEQKQIEQLRRELGYWKAKVVFYEKSLQDGFHPRVAARMKNAWKIRMGPAAEVVP